MLDLYLHLTNPLFLKGESLIVCKWVNSLRICMCVCIHIKGSVFWFHWEGWARLGKFPSIYVDICIYMCKWAISQFHITKMGWLLYINCRCPKGPTRPCSPKLQVSQRKERRNSLTFRRQSMKFSIQKRVQMRWWWPLHVLNPKPWISFLYTTTRIKWFL